MAKEKDSSKTDAMRAAREAAWAERGKKSSRSSDRSDAAPSAPNSLSGAGSASAGTSSQPTGNAKPRSGRADAGGGAPKRTGGAAQPAPSEPHVVGPPSTDAELEASDNRVIRDALAHPVQVVAECGGAIVIDELPAPRAPSAAEKRLAALAALSAPKRVPGADEGICAGCGKIRALSGGKITHHQKGLGKKCPGAGEQPA